MEWFAKGIAMARVLIIDDNDVVSSAMESAFRNDGHETRLVDKPAALDQALSDSRPDVLVLNLRVTSFDPVRLARVVHQSGTPSPMTLVHANPARILGRFYEHCIRPFEVVPRGGSERELLAAVERCLDLRTDTDRAPSS
jgi:DNA-binding NtrC family response regulator